MTLSKAISIANIGNTYRRKDSWNKGTRTVMSRQVKYAGIADRFFWKTRPAMKRFKSYAWLLLSLYCYTDTNGGVDWVR